MRKTSKTSGGKTNEAGTDKAPEPMDPSIRENKVAAPKANHSRVCYAIETLVDEMADLFPETPVEYSNPNGRNTALDVLFDLTVLDEPDRALSGDLLMLTQEDPRVDLALLNHEPYYSQVLVSMRNDPRTMDRREPFGLADAMLVLADDEEGSL